MTMAYALQIGVGIFLMGAGMILTIIGFSLVFGGRL